VSTLLSSHDAVAALHPLNRGFAWMPVRGPFRLISEGQARSFNERGFFVLEDAIDGGTIERLRDAIDPYEAKTKEFLRSRPDRRMFIAEADGISFTTFLVNRSKLVRDFSASPVFQNLCHDLIGPDVRLYWDQAVYKKPEYPKPFPWHQDNGYTYVEPQAYLTCWLALNDATVDNGCPWVIPGGHLRGTLSHRESKLGYVCREHGLSGSLSRSDRTRCASLLGSGGLQETGISETFPVASGQRLHIHRTPGLPDLLARAERRDR